MKPDTFFNGRISIRQDTAGYRYSIDAVLLAGQVEPAADHVVVDLGTGCGVIPLILGYRHPGLRVFGVEVQRELAEHAARNVTDNRMADRIRILCQDMKSLMPGQLDGPADIVVSNPPFHKPAAGRLNPNRQRAMARHELAVRLADVVETAHRVLKDFGRYVTIYAVERLTDLMTQMRACNIEPRWLRAVYSRENDNARLVLVEGIKGGRQGVTVAPPLVIYRADGSYTPEVEKLFQP